jgi:hypothetical protein
MSPVLSLELASGMVTGWLHYEHRYQFAKNRHTLHGDPQASINHIMGTEIANKWHRYQLFRAACQETAHPTAYLQADQQLLKAAAAARGALVWAGVLEGQTFDEANAESFLLLGSHFHYLHEEPELVPSPALLDQPLEAALHPATIELVNGEYQIAPVFTVLAAHAINQLLQQEVALGDMSPPRPGTPSGTIEPWNVS